MHLYLSIYQDSFALDYLGLCLDLLPSAISITQEKQVFYPLPSLSYIKNRPLIHKKGGVSITEKRPNKKQSFYYIEKTW